MKWLLYLCFSCGCAFNTSSQPDMSMPKKSEVYTEYRIKWVINKYYPECIRLCYIHTHSFDYCAQRCEADFDKIVMLLRRAIANDTEDDFDATMNSWWLNGE